jgi:CrcB protein
VDLILVGFGGVFGSLTRYGLGIAINKKNRTSFPLGTFVINITGAFLLGILAGLDTDKNTYLLLADGFLGAFTTFSTFMYEGFNLFRGNKALNAACYISASLIFGVIGYTAGSAVGVWLH